MWSAAHPRRERLLLVVAGRVVRVWRLHAYLSPAITEAVADTVDGLDDTRVGGVGLDLAAQVANVGVDGAIVPSHARVAVDAFQQLLAAEGLARMLREGGQQFELDARQVDRLIVGGRQGQRRAERGVP